MRRTTTTVTVSLALLLAGCGGGEQEDTAEPAAKAAPAAAPAADPKREWTNAVAAPCTDLAGVVAGRQLTAGSDGKITPAEVLAGQKAADPAVAAFDQGYAALTAPPEAAEAKKAYDAFLSTAKVTAAGVLKAAQAGDQAALVKALSAAEGQRLGPNGIQAFMDQGLPEKCRYRASFV